MMAKAVFGACVGLVVVLLAPGAFAAGPAMSVNWTEVGPDQDACVKRASAALKDNKFSNNFEVVSNRTIYGERGPMTAAVRCVADKGVAFIAVAGGDGKETGTFATAIRDAITPENTSPVMNAPPK
jgi:hypothetical protein